MINANSSDFSLRKLEQSLKSDLQPVHPDRRFVGRLRERLVDSSIIHNQRRLALQLLMIAAGLVVGLVTFLLGKRLITK